MYNLAPIIKDAENIINETGGVGKVLNKKYSEDLISMAERDPYRHIPDDFGAFSDQGNMLI